MRAVIGERLREFRYDWGAAFWYAVSYLASAFALYPILLVGVALTQKDSQIDGTYAVVVPGIAMLVIFAVATYRLVTGDPWRRFPTTMVSLYLLQLVGVTALSITQIVRAPYAAGKVLLSLLAPLSFGVLQVDSLVPLVMAPPDIWAPAGAMLGFWLARARLHRDGRPVGAAADIRLRPLRLPDVSEIDGSGANG